MITDEVGRVLISTQNEIKGIKSELELLQSTSAVVNPHEVQRLYGRLREQINKFEENLQNKVDNVLSNAMLNREQTVNHLGLNASEDAGHLQLPMLRYQPASSKSVVGKITTPYAYQQPSYTPLHRMLPNPSSDYTQNLLRSKFDIPIKKVDDSLAKMRPLSSLKPSNLKNRKVGKVSKPAGVLPKHIRDNPFATPQISENDINKGLMNLISRGIVPRDVDLTPAFERGAPPLLSQKARFHQHQEMFQRAEISTMPAHIYNVKYDVESLEASQMKSTTSQNQQQFIRTKDQLTAKPQKVFELKIGKNVSDNVQVNLTDKETTQMDFKLESVKPKGYEEVVDRYSLHQFIIRRGKTLEDTPEFQSYKRTFFGIWTPISKIIELLESLLSAYDIRIAYIDGKRLASLAEVGQSKPTLEQLLECIANSDEVASQIKVPSLMFKGVNGRKAAATKIQATWRMFYQMRQYKRLRVFLKKVLTIQKYVRVFLNYKKTQKTIKKAKETYYQTYKNLAEKLKKDWPNLQHEKRVEIHISSLNFEELQRLSMDKYNQKQNLQITRLFALRDPLVEVIYVAPFDLPPEVMGYYSKVMELGGIPNFQTRFHIVWPDKYHKFPSHFPVTKALIYSPKTQKRILQLIKGKKAYIVPGVPSSDDIQLSAMLNVPLMSGEPQKNLYYSTKSGARTLFQSCEVPTAPGSYNIYDEVEFVITLTKLIAYNMEVNTWLFKIDNEFGGRGHAWVSVDSIKPIQDIRKVMLMREGSGEEQITEELITKMNDIIATMLPHKMRIAMTSVYKNYSAFVKAFIQKGGIIEACPNYPHSQINSAAVDLFIDPLGEVKVVGSYDKFFAQDFVTAGYFFPQKSIKNMNLSILCSTVGQALHKKGVFGYCSIDLIVFPESQVSKLTKGQKADKIFWAIDLKCYMTNEAALTGFFDFLMNGKMDPISGRYTISKQAPQTLANQMNWEAKTDSAKLQEEKRCFMYCPLFYHPGLSTIQYKTFFHMCRLKAVSYDLETKVGSTFILLDSLQTGVLGLFTIGRNRRNVVKYMNDGLNFIIQQAGSIDTKHQDGFLESRSDSVPLTDIVGRVRILHKAYEKKYRKIQPAF